MSALLMHATARPLLVMLDRHEELASASIAGVLEGFELKLAVPDSAEQTLTNLLTGWMVRVGDAAVHIQDRQWGKLERKDVQTFRAERIEWARRRGAAEAVKLTDAMRARIRSIIEAGAQLGLSPDALRRQMQSIVPALPGISSRTRAEMIARTELHNAATWAQEREALGLYRAGADLIKTWTATMDSRTRQAHRRANGQVRQMDQAFLVGGRRMMRPGDPAGGAENVIRCRCVCRYLPRAFINDDRARRAADMIRVAKLAPPERFRAEIARLTDEMDPALARAVRAIAQDDEAWAAAATASSGGAAPAKDR